jgi:hypothetical protein
VVEFPVSLHDEKEGYCRKLGHHLTFAYCRVCREGAPCDKILDCWFEKFDVRSFLEAHYTDEELYQVVKPQASKAASLIELIEKARKNVG